ncbi:MAG: DUF86 domain-containing protein [Spirochaetales bacterium]|nr:DUF86 domain-containing protein [Spirochaetales bacterium]
MRSGVYPGINELKEYLSGKNDIAFAFLFGSEAKGIAGEESDIDIGIYFYPRENGFDLEDDVFFDGEDRIWNDLERLTGREVDLVIFNRASSTICASAYLEGIPLTIKDEPLYLRHFSAVTDLAEEYRYFTEDFIAVKRRSRSLSPADKSRLIRFVDFLETELEDSHRFMNLTRKNYLEDSSMRRNVERWIENLVNGSIDIAKILIASSRQSVPQTYREILLRLDTIEQIGESAAGELADFSKLRNILAHEYLDIRYPQIEKFLEKAPSLYNNFLCSVKEIIKSR